MSPQVLEKMGYGRSNFASKFPRIKSLHGAERNPVNRFFFLCKYTAFEIHHWMSYRDFKGGFVLAGALLPGSKGTGQSSHSE